MFDSFQIRRFVLLHQHDSEDLSESNAASIGPECRLRLICLPGTAVDAWAFFLQMHLCLFTMQNIPGLLQLQAKARKMLRDCMFDW